jgi:type III secretion protein Q
MFFAESSSIQPIERLLPRLDDSTARVSRVLHDARFAGCWQLLAADLRVEPVVGGPVGAVQRLRAMTQQGVLDVLIAAWRHPSLAVVAEGGDEMSGALRKLAAQVLFAPIFERLSAWGLGTIEPLDLTALDGAARAEVAKTGWCAVHNDQGELGRFWVRAFPLPMYAHLQSYLHALSRRRDTLRQALRLPGAVTLAQRPLAMRTLQSLEHGDVVLLHAKASPEERSTCMVRWGHSASNRWAARARVDDFSLTIQEVPYMIDEEQAEALDAMAGGEAFEDAFTIPAAQDPMGALQIPVRFEIETQSVALRDLEAMKPGYVIELRAELAATQVRLVAGGQVVGLAELVAVGDRLGARILALHHDDADGEDEEEHDADF